MFNSKSFTLVRDRFRYTDLRWAKFFVIPGLAAFTLLLILSNVKHPDYYKNEKDTYFLKFRGEMFFQSGCYKLDCDIFCNEVSLPSEKIASLAEGCNEIQLYFRIVKFPEGKLGRNWLTGKFKIKSLRLVMCKLNEIEPGAFSDPMFSITTTIEIKSVHLKYIEGAMLQGLNSLKELKFLWMDDDFTLKLNYLKCVFHTLQKITINIFKPQNTVDPKSLLGSNELPSLQDVDLSENNFGDLINIDSFLMLSAVRNLTLRKCNITVLKLGVFDAITKTVTFIDLSANLIKTLPNDFFKNLLSSPLKRVLLSNNPWNCTCALSSFVEIYKKYPNYFENFLKCATPREFAEQYIWNPNLCSTTSRDGSSFTSITEIKIEDILSAENNLRYNSNSPPETVRLICKTYISDDHLKIKTADVEYFIQSTSPTRIQITLTKFEGQYSLLWFLNASTRYELMEMNYNDYGLGCNARTERNIVIENLKRDATYIFCFIRIGQIQISPFNCHSHYMSDRSEDIINDEVWVLWNSKAATIVFIVIGILVFVIIGATSTFYLISWKPILIRGSKRVIVVKKNRSDVMVLPRNSTTSSSATSNTTLSNQSLQKSSLSRSMSEGSIGSGRSYIIPLNIYEVVHYQQRQHKLYFDRIPNDPPPPLPNRSSDSYTSKGDDIYYATVNTRGIQRSSYSS